MRKLTPVAILALVSAASLLITLAVQYPLTNSFPMGGDAAFYIQVAQNVWHPPVGTNSWAVLGKTWYPLPNFIFSLFRVMPVDWPTRFIWWATIGQIGVGLALGYLAYRLGRWPAAAVTMAIWALTPIHVLNHFESGTIAQLWSFIFLIIFVERAIALDWRLTPLFLILTTLSHPITGAATLMITAVSLIPSLLVYRRLQSREKLVVITLSLTLIVIVFASWLLFSIRQGVIAKIAVSPQEFSPLEHLRSIFQPFVILAPIGLLFFIKRLQSSLLTFYLGLSFISLSTLLTFNNLLGIGVMTQRLEPLFIITICLLAGLALPPVLAQALPTIWVRGLFAAILLGGLATNTWIENKQVYAWQEYPPHYAHLHPTEQAMLLWIKDNTTPSSTIVSTDINRHTEWVQPLAQRRWLPIRMTQLNVEGPADLLQHYAVALPPASYLLIFHNREKIPPVILDHPEWFPLIYSNTGASLFQLSPPT